VDTAKSDLVAATATVRGIEAEARSQRWKLQLAVEDVDNQIALLHARAADFDMSKATLKLAQAEFERARQLVAVNFATREEFDRREAALTVARAGVTQALDNVNQVRVSLGLPAEPPDGKDLAEVPPDLDETFSSILQAQADLIQSAAQLGVVHSYNQTPKQMLAQFESQGDLNRVFAQITAAAPAVKQAEARLESAERDLAQAELDLRYCDIRAEIDGVVTRRNVNPAITCRSARISWRSARSLRSGSMPISRRRSCAICASASLSIYMSTCMAAPMCSRVASPAL
jgi:membrane fusion protein (multidrug efflux system)